MRPLETAFVLLVLCTALWRLAGTGSVRSHRVLAGAASLLGLIQYVVEGDRWQLTVAYLVVVILWYAAWFRQRTVQRARWRATGWIAAGLLSAGLPVMLPIPRLPSPDGPYVVGTTTFVAVDEARAEEYGPDPGGPRILPVHVWYPADPWKGDPPGWLSPETSRAVASEFGLPGFFLDHLRLTETHAVRDAPIVSGSERFPVVIYSHGWTGFGRISPDQPERLASHGYIVIAPDHTYGALVADTRGPVVDGDGSEPDLAPAGGVSVGVAGYLGPELIPLDRDALPDEETVDAATYAARSRQLVATYAADLRFLLDLVTAPEPFGWDVGDRWDVSHIGIYGHSTGGGAAVAACAVDQRCTAVLGLDPWVVPVEPAIIATGLTQPFLALRSDPWVGEENDEVLFELHGAGEAPSTILALRGANHYDFVALSQISPLARYLGFKGPIPGPLAREIVGQELVSFFDLYLKGRATAVDPFEQIRVDLVRG